MDDEVVGEMERALCAFVGVADPDTDPDAGRMARTIAGRRLLRPPQAQPLVDAVADELAQLGASVATGRFRGREWWVEVVNDGPVTVLVET